MTHTFEGVKFTFENLNSNSYLVIEMDERYQVVEHQVEMIANNRCWGILDFDIRNKNNKLYLYYNITSKIDIIQFLKRKKLKKVEFLTILESITSTLLESKAYFLSDKNFILKKEYMFINPITLEVFMVFLPVFLESDTSKNLKCFILDLITSTIIFDEESVNDNFLQKILNCVKEDNFNATSLEAIIKEIRQQDSMENTSENKTSSDNIVKNLSSISLEQIISEIKPSDINNNIPEKTAIPIEIPKKATETTTPKSESKKEPKNESKSTPKKASKGLFDTIGNLFSKKSPTKKTTEKLSTSNEASIPKIEIPGLKHTPDKMPKNNDSSYSVQDLFTNYIDRNQQSSDTQNMQNNITTSYAADILKGKNIEETCILGDFSNPSKTFILKSSNGEEVIVNKNEFLIGRFKEQVDYVISNNTVGKVHAEIICREGKYFVKDLNSRNGTYINQQRIDSNKEYEINAGDKLSFSDSHYVVELK